MSRFIRCALPALACLWAFVSLKASLAVDLVPVSKWNFGAEEVTQLKPVGGVHRDVPGPRSPEYPDFPVDNTAVKLDGNGAYFVMDDPGVQSSFDYTNNDEITLEAWVQLDELRAGENVYLISKGRTGSSAFSPDNQNWALRIREVDGQACVNFLFATARASGEANSDKHWHRWTTTKGFKPGKAWHHVAVSYKFGDPDSMRGWIDGKNQSGRWDMGGVTKEAPIVDNDAIWIGSSRGGAPSNSFRGSLDAVGLYRSLANDALMASRYKRVGGEKEEIAKPAPEVVPDVGEIGSDSVLMTLHEGMPEHNRWLNEGEKLPEESLRWNSNVALFNRLPQRFDEWGIRDAWKTTVLVRIAADVKLSPGTHKFLMRVRGLSRLWVNGEIVSRSKPHTGSPSGEEPMTPVSTPIYPGLRLAEHRQQEVIGEATVDAEGTYRVVLETLVGGKNFRSDPGETLLAIESVDAATYKVVTGNTRNALSLTDSDVIDALKHQENQMQNDDIVRRRSAAATQDDYWNARHSEARQWASENGPRSFPENEPKPIDRFLREKTDKAIQDSNSVSIETAKKFHSEILPILRDNCFRCHGEKVKGGLLLNTREGALRGGDSESPAIVPGNVDDGELLRLIRSDDAGERMPPGDKGLAPELIEKLESWVREGAVWPAPPITIADVSPPPLTDDNAFLRRIYLDTVGEIPSEDEARKFLSSRDSNKREKLIDQLLNDGRWADHWVSYWMDVLAENPTLLNPSLNTTGPFRWFLYDSLLDNKPMDRIVTELIMLRGDRHEGGSAGFGIAADNDAPMAAKGQILGSAFLGVELQCARCHDSPYHSTKQSDLYALAAMFERKPMNVPVTSRVPVAFFAKQQRESLIRVTLKPDEPVLPQWPFSEVTGVSDDASIEKWMYNSSDTRERLATLITSPQNKRFSQVLVNRLWRRLMGAGIVEPPDDWEGKQPSHKELLEWLSYEFVLHDYDVKHILRLICNSDAYQRNAAGQNKTASPELRFFVSPDRRRLSAEQLVDSLHTAAGQQMDVDELTFDPDARRAASNRLTLGTPKRAWMFANLANERDRPSLSLPKARAITDVMEAFGWSGARQGPKTDREVAPNVLQPGVLANSSASVLLTRAAFGSGLANVAIESKSPSELVDRLFVRYLSRLPSDAERLPLVNVLENGFADRLVPAEKIENPAPLPVLPAVTWSNHLRPEATTVAMELEQRARNGNPPDPKLESSWRETYEDVVWSIVNLSEFVWVP